jgi:hypothetical protein
MPKLTRRQVIVGLNALFSKDGIDLSHSNIKDNSSLYAPPFGYRDAGSLQLFLRNRVAAKPPAGFGVYVKVSELGNPPTYGALVDKILDKVNNPAPVIKVAAVKKKS